MIYLAVLVVAFFGFAAGIFFVLFVRSNAGQVPFGSPLGLPGRKVRESKQVWEASHKRAAPYYAAAGAISLIQTLAGAAALIVPSLMSGGYLLVLAATGLVLIVVLMVLAVRP